MATAARQAPTTPKTAPSATDQINVLITGSDIGPEKLAEEARAISPRLNVTVVPNKDALAQLAAEAEVIAGSLPSSLLPGAPRLKWLHSWAAGVVVLPNVAALSDAQATLLDQYVERGGGLVAMF